MLRGGDYKIGRYRTEKNECYFQLTDLVIAAIDGLSSEDRKAFFLRMFSWSDAVDAFAECLAGHSPHEWDDCCDKLRKLCTYGANDAVKTLVANVLEQADKDRQKLEDCKKYIEVLKEAWPTGYEKYFPKHDLFFPRWSDRSEEAAKLLAQAEGEK